MSFKSVDLLAGLREVLPAGAVVTDPDVLAAHVRDHTDLCDAGTPLALARPRDTAQVAAVMRFAHAHGVPVVPQGSRTGLAGGANAVDGCVLLSLTSMNQILELDPVNRLAVVQPGVINAEVTRAAKEHGLRYVPDPGSWEMSTIGGNVATDAGGMCCVKYGVTTEYVLALEVVLADGRIMRCGRRTAKGVAGYDLVGLFTGSEGTLGVITEVTLKLSPIPKGVLTLVAAFPSTTAAGAAVTAITAAGLAPSWLELLDNVHLRAIENLAPQGLPVEAAALLLAGSESGELDDIAAICESSGATEVFAATDETEADMLMTSRRLALTAMEKLGAVIVDDIAVPRSRLAEALDGIAAIATEHDVLIGVVAHAGDGNLHPNIIVDRADPASVERGRAAFDAIMEMCLEMGGTSTGEHGIGMLKREWLEREVDDVNLSVQRALKAALDPTGILNPGKVLLG